MIRYTTTLLWLAAAGSAAAQGTVDGDLRYLDREFTFSGGFTGVETERPAPRTLVRLFDAATGELLGTGFTDLDGHYSIPHGASDPLTVTVRGFTLSETYGSERVEVRDLTGALYSTTGPSLAIADPGQPFDAGTLVAPPVSGTGYVGGPFNLLDQGVRAMEYVTAQGAAGLPQPLTLVWPDSASFASGNEAHLSADDGFDDIVALHEAGHVIHNLYSDSDSPGGSHGFTQSDQDPALSLGEGWASFFAGAVRQHQGLANPGFYLDCDGDGSTGPGTIQLHMRFEDGAPYAHLTGGEADEGAVFCALWDLIDRADTDDGIPGDDDALDGSVPLAPGLDADQVHWAAFTGPTVAGSSYLHVIELWDGLFLDGGATLYAEASDALEAWKIRVREDALEPNDSAAQGTTLNLGDDWTPTLTLYASDLAPPVPGNGDVDVFLVDLTAGQLVEVETRYPGGAADHETYCDTRLTLLAPDGSTVASSFDGGVGGNAKLIDVPIAQSGLHEVRVQAQSFLRPTGSYELRARITGAVGPPIISGISPTAVPSLQPTLGGPLVVQGTNIGTATSVTIDGAPVPFFFADSASQLTVGQPEYGQIGDLDLVVTTPLGSTSAPLKVAAPVVPVLNVADGVQLWVSTSPVSARVAADPGDFAILFVALSDAPTSVPGVLDLDIGGGLAGLFQLAVLACDGAGLAEYPLPVVSMPLQTTFHLQVGVLAADTLALPLAASNTAKGKKFF